MGALAPSSAGNGAAARIGQVSRMCSITITSVQGTESGGLLTSIRVEGTFTDCNEIRVTITCGGALVFKWATLDFAAGTWFAELVAAEAEMAGCKCDELIHIFAHCPGVPGCSDVLTTVLPCEEPECPTISWGPFTLGDCNPDGTTTVTVGASLTSPDSYTAELWDSTGVMLDSVSGSGALSLTGSGDYSGSVTFTVVVTAPPECPGDAISLNLPACAACPNVAFDDEVGPCDEEGNRAVTITAELDSADPYTAELHDAGGAVLDTVTGPGVQILSHSGSYPGGSSQTFRVVVTDPALCGYSEITVDVPSCGCPDVEFDPADVGACDSGGNRAVAVTAHLAAPQAFAAELRDGSGAVLDAVAGSGAQTLSHSGTYPAGSTQTFTVVVTDPAGCEGGTLTVSVPACDGGGDGGDGGDGGLGCGILRVVIAIAAAVGLVAALLALCVPAAAFALGIIAGALALGALIAGIVYALFCPDKPCAWALLVSGQALLGAGVAAILFSACCAWVFWAGLGLVLAGLSALLAWRAYCDESWCRLAKEVTYVIGGIVLPIIGILVGIPLISACVSAIALGVISAIFGPIAAYAAACS
ncbi:MAG: phage holin family protein [Polyangiaceae bacterium]|nr:phage holin family protein [Polyangiaceae bacterium]